MYWPPQRRLSAVICFWLHHQAPIRCPSIQRIQRKRQRPSPVPCCKATHSKSLRILGLWKSSINDAKVSSRCLQWCSNGDIYGWRRLYMGENRSVMTFVKHNLNLFILFETLYVVREIHVHDITCCKCS